MKTNELLLSSLHITEDDYNYKGLFFLSRNDVSVKVDLADVQDHLKIKELKNTFKLEEDIEDIQKNLIEMLVEKAHISCRITEGENYEEKAVRHLREKVIKSLDIA